MYNILVKDNMHLSSLGIKKIGNFKYNSFGDFRQLLDVPMVRSARNKIHAYFLKRNGIYRSGEGSFAKILLK